ncbi:lipase maturation factor family protein [Verrucomicrobiota bacterium sgz303538]
MNVTELLVQNRPEKPLVIFDGDCGFCRFWVRRWQALAHDRFNWEPYQEIAERFPEIPKEAFQEAVQLVETDGRVISGADAVMRVLMTAPGWRTIAKAILRIPPILAITRGVYRFVATHRTFFSRLTRLGWGSYALPPTFAIARRVFAIALGVVFFTAFASLLVQVLGLYGARGIRPIAEFLPAAKQQLGTDVPWRIPSIFWFMGGSDSTLIWTCVAGMACSVILAAGFCPAAFTLLCWALYLSFCSVGSPFLDFQWDSLLLETALVAALFLPWSLRPNWAKMGPVSTVGRWLVLWLLFRLMIESGVVKLSSGDPTWRALTAMDYHYETQPLPLWTAWYAHHGPHWSHWLAAIATFFIEFVAPLGIFAPRNIRHAAAWAMILLQIGIMATGNFAFFNWLTIALCIPLFEDSVWPKRWGAWLLNERPVERVHNRATRSIALVIALPVVVLTAAQLVTAFTRSAEWPQWLQKLYITTAPLRSFNSYGLFAVMTTERPEIVVEGSNDGVVWHEYEFKWKPGDIRRRPGLVAPHQPRLDWQMWFAALGSVRENAWFVAFMAKLLEGSPDVLALLDWNPFPKEPPKYIRAVVYDYHFSEPGTPSAWWRREPKGLYIPAISLSDFTRQ